MPASRSEDPAFKFPVVIALLACAEYCDSSALVSPLKASKSLLFCVSCLPTLEPKLPPVPMPAAPAEVSLSAEQKSLLEKPIDPKANKMLQRGLRRVVPAPPPEIGARILDCL